MNIRHVQICDFRCSELTHITALMHKYPELRNLGKRDVVMLINQACTQIVMILGFFTTTVRGMPTTRYVRSEKIRMLDGERWNPLRIGDYAHRAGIAITNFQLIDEALAPLLSEVDAVKLDWKMAN